MYERNIAIYRKIYYNLINSEVVMKKILVSGFLCIFFTLVSAVFVHAQQNNAVFASDDKVYSIEEDYLNSMIYPEEPSPESGDASAIAEALHSAEMAARYAAESAASAAIAIDAAASASKSAASAATAVDTAASGSTSTSADAVAAAIEAAEAAANSARAAIAAAEAAAKSAGSVTAAIAAAESAANSAASAIAAADSAAKSASRSAASAANVQPVRSSPVCVPVMYRLQVGAFSSSGRAQQCIDRLQAAGFVPSLEPHSGMYRVVIKNVQAADVSQFVLLLNTAGFSEVWVREEK